jgi:hypothetical protein
MACKVIPTGKDTVIEFLPLPLGVCDEPPRGTLTVASGVAVNTGNTTIPLTAVLPSGLTLPSGIYLNFSNPNGRTPLVRLRATTTTGQNTLFIDRNDILIQAGATFTYPQLLLGRTSANFTFEGQTTSATTFDDGFFTGQVVTSTSASAEAGGLYQQLDAAFLNAQFTAVEGRTGYLWITLRTPDETTYLRGTRFKGEVACTSAGATIPADGIIESPLNFTFVAEPRIERPSVTA